MERSLSHIVHAASRQPCKSTWDDKSLSEASG